MTNSQFQVLVEMFHALSQRIDNVRIELKTEMAQGFAKAEENLQKGLLKADRKLQDGLSQQQEISQEILRITGGTYAKLELEFKETKNRTNKRLTLLEKRSS